MPRRRHANQSLLVSAEINVTSLVDVAFTLLVIFIITAPIMQGGVEVQVPRAQAETLASPEGVIVSVTLDEEIYVGESPVRWEEFETVLADVVRERSARTVYLRADQGVPYGSVLRVLGAIKAMDIATVGLVAEPESGGGAAGGGGG
jgi:biopolymer transport protein ExbD/biopolymer transport protein TolR